MSRLQLRKCCCCLNLQTGTQIIGGLSMFGGLGGLVLGLIRMVFFLKADVVNGSEMLLSSAFNQIIGSFVLISITVSLLVAASKNRNPMLLVPWLALKSVSLLLVICYSIYLGIMSVVRAKSEDIILLAGLISGTVIYSYFWLVIYSYYHELATRMGKEAQCNEKC